MVAMETEFKIPAHPVSESLFSKHTMTSLLSPSRMAEMGSRFHIRSLEGSLSHSPKASRAAEGSPGRMRSPKEKHLVRKSPKKSPVRSNEPSETQQHSTKVNGDASSAASTMFLQSRTAAVTNADEAKAHEKPFYFESDHVALKNNADYQNLIKTVCMLEAQRMKAIEDLDKLLKGQEEALKNPIAFVRKLQNKEDLKLPKPQKVTEVPVVNWDQYTGSMAYDQKHRHRTRLISSDSPAASLSSSFPSTSKGNVDDKNKPENFNKPWTIDEQKRLEQLLVEFPPEEVEARRWEKIARTLGNRTMLQVASRVQKYFIKLAKAGLPIPGRMPNLQAYGRKNHMHRHQRFRHFQMNPYSTFMASYEPPVHMNDNDDDFSAPSEMVRPDLPEPPMKTKEEFEEISDDESIPMELRNSEEYKQILSLKKMRKQRLRAEKGSLTRHVGYKCDSCNCDPIIGPRWHCKECPDEISVDFCADCVDMNYENDLHKRDHKIECIKSVLPHIDRDYTKFTASGYNYLDPNYMPAS